MTMRLLCIDLGNDRYAIDLACVRAVLMVGGVRRVPDTPAFLLGLIESPLGTVPLVDLARKFRLEESEHPEETPTAVVVEASLDGRPALMAVAIHGNSRVVEIPIEDVEQAPELGAGIRAEFLRGVAPVDGGVVPLIDLGLTLSATEAEAIRGLQREIAPHEPGGADALGTRAMSSADDLGLDAHRDEYLLFTISGEKAALPLIQLRELVQYRSPTPVPGAARWIRGVINVRGEVIPVVDVAYSLGLPATAPTSRSCSLIAEVGSGDGRTFAALAVDAVLDVVSQAGEGRVDEVQPGLRVPAALVQGIARAADELVPVLDPTALLAGGGTPS